jgi:primosomal protein N'
MVRFIIRHRDSLKAQESAEGLAAQFRRLLVGEAVILEGPAPAQVKKIQNLFRFQILLHTARPGAIQQILHPQMENLCRSIPAEVIADVDPVHLL